MAVTHGHYGTVRGGSHFLAPDNDLTWGAGTINIDGVGMVSVNEGTLEWTVDEPNGVVAFTTDTGDNDNCCLMLGAFQPSTQGGMFCEARFKFNSATLGSVFVGFTETLVLATPVMPAEFATATMTYNGSGGMIGAQFDTDATTNDFRACAGDGGAGGGGDGGTFSPNVCALDGTANTGGGGGGDQNNTPGGGTTGGSGVVLIRYKFQ